MPTTSVSRRRLVQWWAALAGSPLALSAAPLDWAATERAARGQTVRFHAWAGSETINAYLAWADAELRRRHGVTLTHVKVAETADVVRRIRAEKQAGRNANGLADMVWINGENFLVMKREGLLHGPFADSLPAFAAVDVVGKPTTTLDFGEPVQGFEAAWGMAQLTFFGDALRVPEPPASLAALTAFARSAPGRFSYPRPPDFHGSTFLKQVLLEASADRAAFARPAPAAADELVRLTAPLWAALEALHPHLWRQGRQFPASAAAMRQMLADGELWISLSFNPFEAANEIAAGRLPPTVRSWQHAGGTLGNTHFLAIPFNAGAREAALVAINFLQSPLAQARKADIRVWGDPTVLALARLSPADRALFTQADAPGTVRQAAPVWPEPHASWVAVIEREWQRRYAQ